VETSAVVAVVGEGKEKTGNEYCVIWADSQKCRERERRKVRCLVTVSKHANDTRVIDSPASKYCDGFALFRTPPSPAVI
jgi:hypothetical protein